MSLSGRLRAAFWGWLFGWAGSLAMPLEGPALPWQYLKPPAETPGPSSRRSPLVLSEVQYHPAARSDGRNVQFIELFNSQVAFEDISGWSLRGAVAFTFPKNTILPARGYCVVAAQPADLRQAYPQLGQAGAAPVFGPFDGTNGLPNAAGTIRLHNRLGAVVFELEYRDEAPWPVGPDGGGPSLVLARPSYGERHPYAWGPSELPGGSPGGPEPARVPTPQEALVFNEVLAHTDAPARDFVEVYNYSDDAVDLSGCVLTDDPTTNRWVLPEGTRIGARGHLAWTSAQLGFALRASGESLFLYASNRTRLLDAIRFGPQELGVAWGRYPDGAARFSRLESATPNSPNALQRRASVVLNEIMYHPASELADDEYIELHNPGQVTVHLAGWRLEDGVRFTFPSDAEIAPGGFVVVAKNVAALSSNHPAASPRSWFGNFEGSLSGAGERLALTQPHVVWQTNRYGILSSNVLQVVVDEVTYGVGGRWGRWADGGGSSLERRDPEADGRLASNWTDSDETGKSPWVAIQATGPADNGNTAADALQILAHGAGEYLVDDVSVQVSNGTNRVVNGAFTSGVAGWTFQGNHLASMWEPAEGAAGPGSLRLRTSGPGTTGPNRAFTRITPVASGSSVTLKANVRWLKGAPALLVRLKGSYQEIPGYVLAARNLGTPGRTNTAYVSQPVPHIAEVSHFPVLPRASERVRITARIVDRAGLDSVELRYHSDTTPTTVSALPMVHAGAGWYTAELPPLSGFQQFHVVAVNARGGTVRFPDDAPQRECNIRYGDPLQSGVLGQYRLWVSRANVSRWTSRQPLSNDALDTTFVYGSTRAIYNAGSYYSGSPYHAPSYNSPTGNNCDYSVVLPSDDPFLGDTEINLLQPGNGGGDGTGQSEQHAYWIAGQLGLPYCNRRPVLVWFNGVRRGSVYDDAQQPNGDFIRQWYPEDAEGDLRKIQLWFEFDADGRTFQAVGANLGNYVSQGRKKLARYRWNWPRRSYGNNPNNFTNIYNLVDAVNTTQTGDRYTRVLEQATDVDEWFRTHVVEHLVGNNDSYSYGGGQNMYAYKPERAPWQLLIWDIDFAFAAADASSDMMGIGGANVGPINTHPPFARKYYQAMMDAVRGPLDTNRYIAVLDARYNGMRTNGATTVSSPAGIKTYLRLRRDYLIRLINNNSAPLALSASVSNGVTTSANLVTLSGTAPLDARTLTLNGRAIPVTWTSRTAWTARVPFPTGTNLVALSGIDGLGNLLTNPPVPLRVIVTGPTESPEGRIVISEILTDPGTALGASWLELHNTSTSTAYDVSGWRVEGIDYTVPPGTVLLAGGRLVIPSSRYLFNLTYGPQLPVLAGFEGRLNPNGEVLRLVQPGGAPDGDQIISELRYETRAPWPEAEPGASWQLIDAAQDIRRSANWLTASRSPGAGVVGQPATPGAANTGAHALPPLPALSLNEILPENLSTLRDSLGRYRPWLEVHNAGSTAQSLADCFLSTSSADLTAWRFPAESVVPAAGFLIVWLDGDAAVSTAAVPHTDFALGHSGTIYLSHILEGRIGGLDQLSFESPGPDRSLGDIPDGDLLRRQVLLSPTPGAANTLVAPVVQLFINEWLADNEAVRADPADGDYEDWFELYNAGSSPVRLDGFHLSNSPDNPTRFRIPAGYALPPGGHLLVWADGEPDQNAPARAVLHVDFRLNRGGDSIVLAGPGGEILDQVTFGGQRRDVSQGREPDGGVSVAFLGVPTPGTANPKPALPAVFTAVELLGDSTGLRFLGSPERRYVLQRRISVDDLTAPWIPVETLRTDVGGAGEFRIPRAVGIEVQFFRILTVVGD